jgi:hypothetical protein
MVEAMRAPFLLPEAWTSPPRFTLKLANRIENAREEMKDWTKQKVDELFHERGRPAGERFDVLKILAND